jgi:hypothetical protein
MTPNLGEVALELNDKFQPYMLKEGKLKEFNLPVLVQYFDEVWGGDKLVTFSNDGEDLKQIADNFFNKEVGLEEVYRRGYTTTTKNTPFFIEVELNKGGKSQTYFIAGRGCLKSMGREAPVYVVIKAPHGTQARAKEMAEDFLVYKAPENKGRALIDLKPQAQDDVWSDMYSDRKGQYINVSKLVQRVDENGKESEETVGLTGYTSAKVMADLLKSYSTILDEGDFLRTPTFEIKKVRNRPKRRWFRRKDPKIVSEITTYFGIHETK